MRSIHPCIFIKLVRKLLNLEKRPFWEKWTSGYKSYQQMTGWSIRVQPGNATREPWFQKRNRILFSLFIVVVLFCTYYFSLLGVSFSMAWKKYTLHAEVGVQSTDVSKTPIFWIQHEQNQYKYFLNIPHPHLTVFVLNSNHCLHWNVYCSEKLQTSHQMRGNMKLLQQILDCESWLKIALLPMGGVYENDLLSNVQSFLMYTENNSPDQEFCSIDR